MTLKARKALSAFKVRYSASEVATGNNTPGAVLNLLLLIHALQEENEAENATAAAQPQSYSMSAGLRCWQGEEI